MRHRKNKQPTRVDAIARPTRGGELAHINAVMPTASHDAPMAESVPMPIPVLRHDIAMYLQVGEWLYEQGGWVSVQTIARLFGLSVQQVYGCLSGLRRRHPGCYEERRERQGSQVVVHVCMVYWEEITMPPPRIPREEVVHFVALERVDVTPPQATSCQHGWWLQLTLKAWHQVHLETRKATQAHLDGTQP